MNVYVCACRDMGLEVNRYKSKILVVRGESILERIAGIEVKKSIKYLVMEIDEKGSWENNVKRKVEMAIRMAVM